MGWTIETFAGTEATGSPSGWRTAMFEFCRAVNQRESCFPLALTQFRKANGTLGSNLAISDFLGMDPAGSYAIENWEKVMAWIIANLGRFSTADDGLTAWTRVALEEDIDMFAFLSAPRWTTDALFFQQCKEAFDRLIYGRTFATVRNQSATRYELRSGGGSSTLQGVWDNALADTPSSTAPAGVQPQISWYLTRNSLGNYTMCQIVDKYTDIAVFMPDIQGAVTAATHSVRWWSGGGFWEPGDGTLGGVMSCSFLGNSYSQTGLSGGAQITETKNISVGGLPRGAVTDVSWSSNYPSVVPLSAPDPNYDSRVVMYLNDITVCFDMSSELDDQA